jgi:UDP-2,4-diacetamido-2,4,6-trideoxy-beta-L-altropyranose hydrolase
MVKDNFDCTLILNKSIPTEILPNNINYIFIDNNTIKDEVFQIKKIINSRDVLLLDGYEFNFTYQKIMKNLVYKLILVDDFKNSKVCCDILINHGIKNIKERNNISYYTGFPYLILRPEFLRSVNKPLKVIDYKNAFICFGGSDPYNITNKILKTLVKNNTFDKILVVIGAANKFQDVLIEKFKNTNIQFYINSSSKEIIKLLEYSSIAISTSSTIALEICCTKTPLLCGYINNNQKCIDNLIVTENCGISIGNWKYATSTQINSLINQITSATITKKIIQNQSNKIDGKSKERYKLLFKKIFNE